MTVYLGSLDFELVSLSRSYNGSAVQKVIFGTCCEVIIALCIITYLKWAGTEVSMAPEHRVMLNVGDGRQPTRTPIYTYYSIALMLVILLISKYILL